MSGESTPWDSLIRKAVRGEILPEAAEAEAKALGFGPLARKPKESMFDPMPAASPQAGFLLPRDRDGREGCAIFSGTHAISFFRSCLIFA
jgi:hypothetical protein